MTQLSLIEYGEPEFSSRRYLITGHRATAVEWPDGFSMILPIDPVIIEDSTFRPELVLIVNERRAKWEETHS